MESIEIRQYGRLSFDVQRADDTAVSATFIFSNDTKTVEDTIAYDSNGTAHFEFGSPDTDVAGEYEFQVNENFESGSPDIYPNVDNCDGDCDLPTLVICESLSAGGS